MLKAADYRDRARASLNGKWGMGVLVCFLSALLGGMSVVSPVSVSYAGAQGGIVIEFYGVPINTDYLSRGALELLMTAVGVAGVFTLVKFVVGSAVELGMRAYFSKQALGVDADVQDVFAYFKYFGKALGLRVIMQLFITLWTFLLIVPGIIAAYRYAMAPYIMAEHPEIGIMEALEQSKQMMDGNKWRLFCLEMSFFGWALLSALTCGIGQLFLNPYMQMAFAHFYMSLSRGGNNGQNREYF